MKHCIDCKFCLQDRGSVEYSHCGKSPKEPWETTDQYRTWLVTGGPEPEHSEFYFCSTARGESGNCGTEAKLFEPKEVLDSVTGAS